MATKPAAKPVARPAPTRTQMDVFLGKAEKPLGRLIFVKDGQREFSQFAYSPRPTRSGRMSSSTEPGPTPSV